jgi:hypothetical protein
MFSVLRFTTADTEDTEGAQRLELLTLCAPSVLCSVCGGEDQLPYHSISN